jgi:hypothetical protein
VGYLYVVVEYNTMVHPNNVNRKPPTQFSVDTTNTSQQADTDAALQRLQDTIEQHQTAFTAQIASITAMVQTLNTASQQTGVCNCSLAPNSTMKNIPEVHLDATNNGSTSATAVPTVNGEFRNVSVTLGPQVHPPIHAAAVPIGTNI